VEALQLDAADAASRQRLAATVAARFSRQIDLLVVNAGVFHKEWTEEGLSKSVAVNTVGAVDCAVKLGPLLAPSALIIAVSSSAACVAVFCFVFSALWVVGGCVCVVLSGLCGRR